MVTKNDLQALANRIEELKDTFIPEKAPTGIYSQEDEARTAAFVILVHAEVEWFIEKRCQEVLTSAVDHWKLDNRPRSTVLSLLAFCNKGETKLAPDGKEIKSQRASIRLIVDEAKKTYSKVLYNNHGIRVENLLAILRPIGIREFQLPDTFLVDVDTFGTMRGRHAHRSIGAQTPPDPVDTLELVRRIVVGVSELDGHLQVLENEGLAEVGDESRPNQSHV